MDADPHGLHLKIYSLIYFKLLLILQNRFGTLNKALFLSKVSNFFFPGIEIMCVYRYGSKVVFLGVIPKSNNQKLEMLSILDSSLYSLHTKPLHAGRPEASSRVNNILHSTIQEILVEILFQ